MNLVVVFICRLHRWYIYLPYVVFPQKRKHQTVDAFHQMNKAIIWRDFCSHLYMLIMIRNYSVSLSFIADLVLDVFTMSWRHKDGRWDMCAALKLSELECCQTSCHCENEDDKYTNPSWSMSVTHEPNLMIHESGWLPKKSWEEKKACLKFSILYMYVFFSVGYSLEKLHLEDRTIHLPLTRTKPSDVPPILVEIHQNNCNTNSQSITFSIYVLHGYIVTPKP